MNQYIERSKRLLESSEMNEKNVEFKIIQPLIEILGWDLYMDVESEYTVQVGSKRYRVDYALSIGEAPAIFVEAKSSSSDLNGEYQDQLTSYMHQTGTDWGLLTNGNRFQILKLNAESKLADNSVLAEFSIDSIEQEWNTMEVLSKEMIQSGESYHLAEELGTKKKALQEIEENKEAISLDISEILAEWSDDTLFNEFEKESALFIENMLQRLRNEPSDAEIPSSSNDILEILGPKLPGRTDEVRSKRAEIILSAFDFLRQNETANRAEIGQSLLERYPNVLSGETSEFERHWVNYIRDSLAGLPRIEQPARGAAQLWRYIPSDLAEKLRIDDIDEWILNLDDIPSGNKKSVKHQQAMIQESYDYIRDVGKADKDDIKAALPDYTAHYQRFNGFWSYCLREALAEADDIESPVSGHQYWYYIGGDDGELEDELNIEIDDWVLNEDIPGEQYTKKQRQSLLQFAYNYVKASGEARKMDFEQHFESTIPEQTGKYNTFDGLWSYLLKDGISNAPSITVHKSGKSGPATYKYTGK